MIIQLMGPQGSGKGTIGEMLSDYLSIPLISVGQTLREVPQSHPKYKELHEYMDAGKLAPNEFTAHILKERLSKDDCTNGYILDSWSRNMDQLDYFLPPIDVMINLNIAKETSIKRLSSRRTCSKCGDIYNIVTVPPQVEGICDECGGKLVQRKDDTPEAIEQRLKIYYEETQAVLDFYDKKGQLINIDGEPAPEVVFESVKEALFKK